jgi:predicted ATPase
MIQSIEIKNFKSIKKKYFPLRKLNLLLGLNGMGKSSFIQSFLLMRQSFGGLLQKGELRLNGLPGGYINLGKVKDAKYQYNEKEDIGFFLQFQDSDVLEMNFNEVSDSDVLRMGRHFKDIVNKFPFPIDSESLFNNKFQYLNANRIPPQSNHMKSHQNVVELNNLGNYGEYTAHFIETFGDKNIEFDNLVHKNSVTKDEVTGIDVINKTLINQINLWMGEISPGIIIRAESPSTNSLEVTLDYAYVQPYLGSTNRFRPENVGFGISYALHVVTALLASRPGELIIIENPESHIHPRGQAELGKLIALTAQNDVQLIIETHSDHIVNGIRVAVKETPELKDEAIIFYFDKVVTDTEQYSKVTNIEIDKNGELSEYPPKMMDEWSNQLLKLL